MTITPQLIGLLIWIENTINKKIGGQYLPYRCRNDAVSLTMFTVVSDLQLEM